MHPGVLLQIAVEQEEGSAIEQQVPPCDVNERVSEPAPPFAVAGGIGNENEARVTEPLEEGPVQGEEENGERGEFDFMARVLKVSLLTPAPTGVEEEG